LLVSAIPTTSFGSHVQMHKSNTSQSCVYFQNNAKNPKNKYQTIDTTSSSQPHHGQHFDCPDCVMIPTSDLKMYGLPRERLGNRITLPERSLEPTNNTPKFKNG